MCAIQVMDQVHCVAHSPRERCLAGDGGRTTPIEAYKSSGIGTICVYFSSVRYEVSHTGTSTERSHTAAWRYTVWTSCMRPCWQIGHTDPGSGVSEQRGQTWE